MDLNIAYDWGSFESVLPADCVTRLLHFLKEQLVLIGNLVSTLRCFFSPRDADKAGQKLIFLSTLMPSILHFAL